MTKEQTQENVEETVKVSNKKTAEVASKHDDFDWDADGAGFQSYSSTDREKMENAYVATFQPVTEKQVVKGTVVAINDKDVVVNIGFKSDGLVSRQEFRDMPDLSIGDSVEVFIDVAEDKMVSLF